MKKINATISLTRLAVGMYATQARELSVVRSPNGWQIRTLRSNSTLLAEVASLADAKAWLIVQYTEYCADRAADKLAAQRSRGKAQDTVASMIYRGELASFGVKCRELPPASNVFDVMGY